MILGELALACLLLSRRPEAANRRLHRGAVELLGRVIRRRSYVERAWAVSPHAVPVQVLLWHVVRAQGIPTRIGFRKLADVVGASGLAELERLPYQLLEARYFLDLAELDVPLPTLEEAVPLTTLYRHREGHDLAEPDLYALTHSVFYLSDFGRTRVRGVGEEGVARARRTVLRSLPRVRTGRNWDLVLELLAAYRFLGGRADPRCDRAWSAVAKAQRGDGAVPTIRAQQLMEEEIATLEAEHGAAYFRAFYHPTLMALIAGLAWSSRNEDTWGTTT